MIRFSCFDRRTGIFTGKQVAVGSTEQLRIFSPNLAYVEGFHDRLAHRVVIRRTTDKETGEDIEAFDVVDYQPPKPNDECEWDEQKKRWLLTEEARQSEDLHAAAVAEIKALEESQLRPMRELMLDPKNEEASQRLDAIETRIIELRIQLKR